MEGKAHSCLFLLLFRVVVGCGTIMHTQNNEGTEINPNTQTCLCPWSCVKMHLEVYWAFQHFDTATRERVLKHLLLTLNILKISRFLIIDAIAVFKDSRHGKIRFCLYRSNQCSYPWHNRLCMHDQHSARLLLFPCENRTKQTSKTSPNQTCGYHTAIAFGIVGESLVVSLEKGGSTCTKIIKPNEISIPKVRLHETRKHTLSFATQYGSKPHWKLHQ